MWQIFHVGSRGLSGKISSLPSVPSNPKGDWFIQTKSPRNRAEGNRLARETKPYQITTKVSIPDRNKQELKHNSRGNTIMP